MELKVAKEDMVTFKNVRLSKDRTEWRAVYQSHYRAKTNVVLTADGSHPTNRTPNFLEVGRGVFHSCADLNSMKHWGAEPETYIVKCIVPKGTKYYASKVPNDVCSEQIIVTDIIIAGDGINSPQISEGMMRRADICEAVTIKGKRYLHVKDADHEVFLSAMDEGRYPWKEAMEKFKLPSTDDWDLIDKYRPQVDKLIAKLKVDPLNWYYWSLSEFYNIYAWCYYGYTGRFYYNIKSNDLTCRSVLALDS